MAQNTKGLKGQGHTSRSSVKVTYLYTALRLLLLNKHKKFEDDANARFCCSASESKRRKKKPTATTPITILTESTSRSVIMYIINTFIMCHNILAAPFI